MANQQYQVLARKYRPKNFGELLGQDHVAKALSNAIDTGRLHHAYLFTGTRGVGKTTIARILAKCLNCETGVTSQPCGECATCQSIDRGQFIDLIEIDAASRTKVEDTRELLENVPYAPVQGRYKVYLIDEVHMLSTRSFNALLKTLEEPPEHVKFLFATTDPQKLPITIISRCLQFVLRPMSQALLSEHLQKILTLEKVPFAKPAIWQLAAAAKGSVRDSLSLTDQAIAFGGGQIGEQTVNEMLGLLDGLDVIGLLTAIGQDDRLTTASYIEQLRLQMVDVLAVFDRLIETVYQVALLQGLPDLSMDRDTEQQDALATFAKQISADVLQLYYEILTKGKESVRLANTPMQALEMSILRMLAFRPLMTHETIAPAGNVAQATHSTTDDLSDHSQNTQSVADTTNQAVATKPSEQIEQIEQRQQPDEPVEPIDTQSNEPNITQNLKSVADAVAIPSQPDTPNEQRTAEQDLTHPSDDNVDNPNLEPSLAILADDTMADDTPDEPLANDDNAADEQATEQTDKQAVADDTQNETAVPEDNACDEVAPNTPFNREQMLVRLQPPVMELQGKWSPQSWDYWLYLARQKQVFDVDELALLDNALMTGSFDDSQLVVSEQNSQIDLSFIGVLHKISNHFREINLSEQLQIGDIYGKTPRAYREGRLVQLRIDAQNQLIQSPVFSELWQAGFVIDDGQPVLMSSKLSID